MFKKIGDAREIRIKDYSSVQSIVNPETVNDFIKQAKAMKKIAPKADDFLYFSTVMMHAAEAAIINEDGSPKMYKGKPVEASWDESTGTCIWKCSDPGIQPYRNQRGDIFPEAELVKAHKEWIGKPLCIDHQATSVDHTRGFIVDTVYDFDLKRIIALAAIDKKNYPELAHKVSSGMSNNVSMGTGVGRAVCTEKGCHKVIKAANEFCEHMKYKTGYGEINLDLSPIELSIVVAGADKRAKIKNIIASVDNLNNYVSKKEALLKKGSDKEIKFTSGLLEELKSFISDAESELEELKQESSSIEEDQEALVESSFEEEQPDGELISSPGSARLASELNEMKKAANALESRLSKMHDKVYDISFKFLVKSANALESKVDDISEKFDVSVNYSTISDDGDNENRSFQIASDNLDEMKSFLDTVVEELGEMQSHSSELDGSDKKETFDSMTDNIESKISSLKQQYNTLIKGYNMALDKKAYFQGGGGVNEPTPGSRKYEVDPLNDKLRSEDHHMKGAKPFPEGGSDGLLGGSEELALKKHLKRASEELQMKREAAVEAAREALKKQGYFQGGGGDNEPTPGKKKYPVDPMNDKLRSEDHHMKGQKPFPEVGDVTKLYGDDLAKKKKLSRAGKLNGQLIKAAELGDYTWKITDSDGNVLLKEKVSSLAKGDELLFTSVASESYGRGLMTRIQKQAMAKFAQDAGAPAMPAEMPMPASEMPMPEAAPMAAPEAATGTGDIKPTAVQLATQIRDLSSDLLEIQKETAGEAETLDAVNPKTASALQLSRKASNEAMGDVIAEMISDLGDRKDELVQITGMIDSGKVNGSNSDLFQAVAEASFDESKKAIAQGKAIIGTFLKYARGVSSMVKQAQLENELAASELEDSGSDFEDDGKSLTDILNEVDSEMDQVDSDLDSDSDVLDTKEEDMGSSEEMMSDDEDVEEMDSSDEEESDEEEMDSDDLGLDLDSDLGSVDEDSELGSDLDSLFADMVEVKTPDGKTVTAPTGSEVKTVTASRTELRAKIAAKAMQLSGVAAEMADSVEIGGIDASGDMAVSENIADQQEKTMSVVLGKVKVRKEADRIHQLVSQGELDSNDLDSLVALGVDPEAVKYYKEFYGQADGEGKEFAAALTKENMKAQAAEEVEAFKVKIARAYQLVNEMVSKDLIASDAESVSNKVDEIVQYNDVAFDSIKRVIASAPARKVTSLPISGILPQNGLIIEASAPVRSENSAVQTYMDALQGARSSKASR